MLRSTHDALLGAKTKLMNRYLGELIEIDALLARRPAFDSFSNRVDKITLALANAAQTERAAAEVARLQGQLSAANEALQILASKVQGNDTGDTQETLDLEKQLSEVNASIRLTEQTPAIVTFQRTKRRTDLEQLFTQRRELETKLQKSRAASAPVAAETETVAEAAA